LGNLDSGSGIRSLVESLTVSSCVVHEFAPTAEYQVLSLSDFETVRNSVYEVF